MHDYTDINYIDTCIYKNLNFISNSYRGMYNLKDCNEMLDAIGSFILKLLKNMECQFFMIQDVAKIDGSDSIIGKTKMKERFVHKLYRHLYI
jgi:hypothetical protein